MSGEGYPEIASVLSQALEDADMEIQRINGDKDHDEEDVEYAVRWRDRVSAALAAFDHSAGLEARVRGETTREGRLMDPDEALRILRLTIKQMRVDEHPDIRKAHADEIAEYFEALDEWLSNGGFAPQDWQPRSAS